MACQACRVVLKRAPRILQQSRILQVAAWNHGATTRWFSSSAIRDTEDDSTTTTTATSGSSKPRMMSPQDMKEEADKQFRLADVPIGDILKAKHSHRWVNPILSHTHSIQQAIDICIEGGLSAAMVTNDKHVVGLVTSRDLLRSIHLGLSQGESGDQVLNRKVGDSQVMTPLSKVIYARPDETVGMCRTIMAKLGIKCLPVLSREGVVEGLVTARDMSQYRFTASDKGGKKSYLKDVSERVGLGAQTSMADPPTFLQAHLALEQTPVFINIGTAQLPHPFKTADGGIGMNQRGKLKMNYPVLEGSRPCLW
jgi:CBS domain-containing protein